MKLTELFENAPDIEIRSLMADSRKKRPDSIFFCVKGMMFDGHKFIDQAVENGAKVIVYSEPLDEMRDDVTYIRVKDVISTFNKVADAFYGFPSHHMTMFGISEGAAKTIGQLGYWGIPLIGVITAILMGLLNSAKATAASSKASTTPKTKLVSSMLTYDEGNVKRFIGQDGKVYTATEEARPKDGLVTHPIATTVQGQPALVAENGPEIVVGRRTTQAIMMNEPELIKYLANYERYSGRRLFDTGNISDYSDYSISSESSGNEMRQTMNEMRTVMSQVLYYLQHPVRPKIDMYSHGGEDGLYDSMQKATAFMSQYH